MAIHLDIQGSNHVDGALWRFGFGQTGKEDVSSITFSGNGSLIIEGEINCSNMFKETYSITDAAGGTPAFDGLIYGKEINFTVTISCGGSPQSVVTLSNVPVGVYYADAVKWVVDLGITNGPGEGGRSSFGRYGNSKAAYVCL